MQKGIEKAVENYKEIWLQWQNAYLYLGIICFFECTFKDKSIAFFIKLTKKVN